MEEDQKIMKGMKEDAETWNLSKGEWEVLKGLRGDSSVVIKLVDKGSTVVVMDREQYVREAVRQLKDCEFHKELEKPIYLESVKLIKGEM